MKPTQQLKAAERLAATYPLFADQLAPELPALKQQVEQFGNKEPATEPRFAVGQVVLAQGYSLEPVHTVTVRERSPSWGYSGQFNGWYYYLTYGPDLPAAFWFMNNVPLHERHLQPRPDA